MHCCKQINSYIFFKKVLTSAKLLCIINLAFADVAHPVERNLAKVEVASSSLVIRSKTKSTISMVLFVFYKKRGSKRAIRQDSNSPVDCCGARVRAEESFSFRWASLVIVDKFDFVLSKVMYCGRHHLYGAFFFYKKRGSKRAIRFTTVLIFALQVFKRVLYSNGNEKQRGITMHQDVEKILVTEEELNAIAHRLAKQITKDYEGKKLLLVGVLKGSIYFFTDLTRYIDLPCNIDFIQASSYGAGTVSSGNIQIIKDIADDLTGFDVLLVEDILDTGNTLKYIHDMLSKRNPESIGVVTLLDKPARRTADIKADYVGVDVPDAFVVGYGLDYDQYYRNLPYIGVLKKSIYEK